MTDEHRPRQNRPVVALAAFGLLLVALIGTSALAWSVVSKGSDAAALVSTVSLAVGALATLAGTAGRRNGSTNDSEGKLPSSDERNGD